MTLGTQAGATDLMVSLPGQESWDPFTVHTHYFGFSIPEHRISAFIYVRWQPVYRLISGGVCIFEGLDNVYPNECAHLNYVNTMPYPEFVDNTITTDNGLCIQFIEPGKEVRLTYRSADGETSFDLRQSAVSPLVARGHVFPTEVADTPTAQSPGGSEQFMQCVGELQLNGRHFDVDCHPVRDRSWRQVRTELEIAYPPVGWSPMYFDQDLAFNQISFEPLDTDPDWKGIYDLPDNTVSHHFAFILVKDEIREITRVRRNVIERHPTILAATKQEIEVTDEYNDQYLIRGEAIAMANLPAWPNATFADSLYRWEDGHGRIAYGPYQEVWFGKYHRARSGRESFQTRIARTGSDSKVEGGGH